MIVSVRRVLCSVALLSVYLAASAATAGADLQNYQGDRYRNLGGNDNGTRAYIAGTGHTNSPGEIVSTVSIQNSLTYGPPNLGGFQIGEVQQDPGWGNYCSTGRTAVFAEYLIVGSFTYHCKIADINAFGNGGLFAVAVGSNGWKAFWNSNVFLDPPALGFSDGWTVARAETWLDPNNSGPAYAMTWGPAGQIAWQFKTASQGYTTIDTSKIVPNTNTLNEWAMGGTPSPFNINWVGF